VEVLTSDSVNIDYVIWNLDNTLAATKAGILEAAGGQGPVILATASGDMLPDDSLTLRAAGISAADNLRAVVQAKAAS
jgi:hypothetical protein